MLLGVPEFELLSSTSLEEACSYLTQYGEDARVLAGGSDLLVIMKHKRLIPKVLINIKGIPDLDHIHYDEQDGLHIGALTTIQAIKDASVIGKKFSVLNQTAGCLGTTQIRNIGTLGGNLCNASPAAEFGPILLTLGGAVKCVGHGGERRIPMEKFFVSPGKSSLKRDEVVTEVHVPNLPPKGQAIYLKHSLRKMDVSIAGAAVNVVFDGDVCKEVRIALGSVAPKPFRAKKAEKIIKGQKLSGDKVEGELVEEVARVASEESKPIDDIREYAVYRKKIVGMLVKQGLNQVIKRARA